VLKLRSPIDVLIASVLVDAELPALLHTFGLNPGTEYASCGDMRLWYASIYNRHGPRLTVGLTCLDKKTNWEGHDRTSELLSCSNPRVAFLVGCAAGRKARTDLCDVVISADGVLNYEGGTARRGIGTRPDRILSKEPLPTHVRYCHTDRAFELGWKDSYETLILTY
jgi:hypothetical protein